VPAGSGVRNIPSCKFNQLVTTSEEKVFACLKCPFSLLAENDNSCSVKDSVKDSFVSFLQAKLINDNTANSRATRKEYLNIELILMVKEIQNYMHNKGMPEKS
jgi:hypothetical protein